MTSFLIGLALLSIFPTMFIWEDYEKNKDERDRNV